MESNKIKHIINWMEVTVAQYVTGNRDNLTQEQHDEIVLDLSMLKSGLTEENASDTLLRANAVVRTLNAYITESRRSKIPSLEEFLRHTEDDEMLSYDFVVRLFDDMLALDMYDQAVQYMTAVKPIIGKNDGAILCMLTASNPISPLTRPIPAFEDVKHYMQARYDYFISVWDHYKTNGYDEMAALMKADHPDAYYKEVAEYDAMYIGEAPKRK